MVRAPIIAAVVVGLTLPAHGCRRPVVTVDAVPDQPAETAESAALAEVQYDLFMRRGSEAYRRGDNAAAIKELTLAIEAKPAGFDAFINRGIVYQDLGAWQLALDELRPPRKTACLHPYCEGKSNMNENEQTPNDKWSLDRLGAFCVERDRRMAVDAWKTGMAMYLAKNRCKDEGESFTEWKKKHGFSNAKVSRYIRLYRAFPSEVHQKRLIEIGIMQALREAGIAEAKATSCGNTVEQEVVDDDSTAEPTIGESESDHTERAAKELPRGTTEQRRPLAKRVNDHTAHSWAVETDDSDDELPDTEEYLVDMLSRGETLEECRKAVPWQTRILRQNVESLLGQDQESLRKAWSECETDRRQFADDLDALLRLLPDLSATLPDDGGAALALAG